MVVVRRPTARWARAIRARVPPSPLLSARIRKVMYLMVTIRVRVQITSETTPSTASSGDSAARVPQRLAHRIEGAGADVAEHHADGAQAQRREAAFAEHGGGIVGGRWRC